MRSFIVACSLLALPVVSGSPNAQPVTHLARVQQLGLQSLTGTVPTYYSPGAQARAESLQAMLNEAVVYFRARLNIEPQLALAVLNEAHWAAVRALPYGIPGVSSAPHIVFLPADLQRSVIVHWFSTARTRASAATRQALLEAGVPFETVPYRLNDFIGYHEVGHVVIEALGLSQTQGWFNEILATFAAYAFMRDHHPDYARAWDALMQFNVETRRPDFRSLNEFERQYAKVDLGEMSLETFGWFQGMFHVRAAEVHSARGPAFLADLRSAGVTAGAKYETPAELLTRLEAIVPGFQRWAQVLEGPRRDSIDHIEALPNPALQQTPQTR